MLELGIVSLPNVGKSTLFNALTSAKAEAANYPFCTVEPNVGMVEVPDPRLEELTAIVKPKRATRTGDEGPRVLSLRAAEPGSDDPAEVVPFSARIEAELAELPPEDRHDFLASLGLESAGLDRLIRAGYHLMGLQTYFTAGDGSKGAKVKGVVRSEGKEYIVQDGEVLLFQI